MARTARIKAIDGGGWYLVSGVVTDQKSESPLAEAGCAQKLQWMLERYAGLYVCRMASFCIGEKKWRAVMHFSAPQDLEESELYELALRFYPGSGGKSKLEAWGEEDWQCFSRRVFNVSEFMRNVQGQFARWYNDKFDRKGRFWADRFESILMESAQEALDAMLYAELSPVRSGNTELPEEHPASSCFLRDKGKSDWLMKVGELLEEEDQGKAEQEYRSMLIWRGTEPGSRHQQKMSRKAARREEKRGYKISGAFLKQVTRFTRTLVIGSAEFVTRHMLSAARRRGSLNPEEDPYFGLLPVYDD